MEKLYDKVIWHNNASPALNEDNLNGMSDALDGIDDRVISIAGDVLVTVPQLQTLLADANNLIDALQTMTANPPYIGANGNWYTFNTNTMEYEDSGVDASISVTIADVTAIAPDATPYVTNTGTSTDPVFHLFIPRGAKGDTGNTGATGATPVITATASVSGTTGTPAVNVTQSGTAEAPTIAFAFSGLKGEQGATGQTGATGADGVSPDVTISTITGGHRVTITDKDHPSGQSFDVMDGSGSGDMSKSVYDSANTVANAGGITAYVSGVLPASPVNADWNASSGLAEILNKPTIPTVNDGTLTIEQNNTTIATFTANQSGNQTANIKTDVWTPTGAVDSSGGITFNNLDDSYAYELFALDTLVNIKSMTKTGSGTHTTLSFTTDAPSGTTCKLRVLR